jgi:hypothetical protein
VIFYERIAKQMHDCRFVAFRVGNGKLKSKGHGKQNAMVVVSRNPIGTVNGFPIA